MTYRIYGNYHVDVTRFHKQRLDGHELAVNAAVHEREQRLVAVNEAFRLNSQERVRDQRRIQANVSLRECLVDGFN